MRRSESKVRILKKDEKGKSLPSLFLIFEEPIVALKRKERWSCRTREMLAGLDLIGLRSKVKVEMLNGTGCVGRWAVSMYSE